MYVLGGDKSDPGVSVKRLAGICAQDNEDDH